MATLTEYQKHNLDSAIKDLISTLVVKYKNGITSNELLTLIMDNTPTLPKNINVRNVIPAIDRVFNNCGYRYNDRMNDKVYQIRNHNDKYIVELCKSFAVSNVVKDKNILTFVNQYRKNGNLVYDFSQHKFIHNNPKDYVFSNWEERDFFDYSSSLIEELYSYEWVFNYINDFSDIRAFFGEACRDDNVEIIKICPKGFIKYLNETNECFSYATLKNFNLTSKYGTYGVNIIKSLYGDRIDKTDIDTLDWLIKENLLPSISKMLNYSLKAGYIPSAELIRSLIDDIYTLRKGNVEFSIDINKTVKQNLELAEIAKDKKRNEALAYRLQRLNFINGLTDNKYIVVVPQNQEEKKNEGEQQHNCVGYYYDSSILRGENFIFFVRKVNNPKKSYITCRYNKDYKKVTEYRGFANHTVNDTEAVEFIKKVEAIIKEHEAEL